MVPYWRFPYGGTDFGVSVLLFDEMNLHPKAIEGPLAPHLLMLCGGALVARGTQVCPLELLMSFSCPLILDSP